MNRHLATLFAPIIILLLGTVTTTAQPPQPKFPKPGTRVALADWKPTQQEVVASYWTLEPGWNTELEIRNNLVERRLTVTPVLRTVTGREIALPDVSLASEEVTSINLQQAVAQVAPELVSHVGSFGSAAVRFAGLNDRNVFVASMVYVEGHPIDFHFDGFDAASNDGYFRGFEGIWWLPAGTSTDFLIVSNPSRKPVTGTLGLTSASGISKQSTLTLGPLQTARIDIRQALGSSAGSDMGGLTLTFPNNEGISASQIVFDEVTGLAAIMKLFERDKDESVQAHILRAPMIALRQPDAALAYPKDTVLNPRLFLRNAGTNNLQVSAAIHWRSQTTEGTYNYPTLSLTPNEVNLVDLGLVQNSGAIPANANWGNVTLSYTGKSADLVPVAVSYDSKQRYGLQSPFTEGTNRMFKGSMWHVDSTHNSLITTGNGGSETTNAQVTLFYNGGQSHYRIEKLLAPGQQLLLDVGQLIHNQVPDSDGNVIPPDTMTGSYELQDLDHPAVGLLYEGKLTVDKTYGHASYGCASCCGLYNPKLNPNPYSGPPSVYNQDSYLALEQCGGQWEDWTGTAYSWQSTNTAVATLPNSVLYTVAVGTATGSAQNVLQATHPAPRCPQAVMQGNQPVTVVPTITGPNTVWWFNGQNPSGYNTSVTLTSSGGSSTSWSITTGPDKVRLSGMTGASVTVTSTGTAWSTFPGDIGIVATANSVPSATFVMTSRRPYSLEFPQFVPNCDPSFGYVDALSYQIQDQLLTAMPAQVDWNEKFTTGIVDDYPPFDNWSIYGLPVQEGSHGTFLVDNIQGPGLNNNPPPSPVPACHGTGTQIQHWGQEFRIGTLVVGGGQRVQTDNLTRFVNHAEHDAQVSPAP